jgi:nucleotide-binding universal stress UspA family protein
MNAAVLCATDFSDASEAAVTAAAHLARTFEAPLLLVHVFERLPVEAATGPAFGPFAISMTERAGELETSLRDALARRLAAEAIALSQRGARVEARLLDGAGRPWEALLDEAGSQKARMIVMGTHGRRGPARWLLGSVAERTVRGASCPVLVVPSPPSGRRGSPGEKTPFRVMVALDPQDPSPVGFVRDLRAARPCEVVFVHLFWPPAEIKRRRILPYDVERPPPELIAQIEKDLRATAGVLPGTGHVTFVVKPEWGRARDSLYAIANELSADLLVTTASGMLKRIQLPVVFVPSSDVNRDPVV